MSKFKNVKLNLQVANSLNWIVQSFSLLSRTSEPVKEETVALVVSLMSLYTSITTKEGVMVATRKVAYSNYSPRSKRAY